MDAIDTSAPTRPEHHMTIENDYLSRTQGSRALAASAAQFMPDGVSTDTRIFAPYGIYVARAEGTRKWDVDGNEYRDFFGGHGALMLGHAHPVVTAAVQQAVARGIQYAASAPQEVEWASLICQHVPTAEKVRFAASGSEATLLAMRMARAYSGRTKIMRVCAHYHGWHDFAVSGYAAQFDGSAAPGVLPEIAANTILVRHDDEDAMRAAIRQHADDLAAVILEPLGSHFGVVPTSDAFIRAAFDEARANGVLVILDEVVSGFRIAMGGYQAETGLRPDLTSMGKVAAGGMPGGLVCGRDEVMQVLSRDGRDRQDRPAKVFHQGTFTGNPVTATSAIETIRLLGDLDGCRRATETATVIRAQVQDLLLGMGTNWRCYGRYSAMHFLPDAPDAEIGDMPAQVFQSRSIEKLRLLRMALLVEGADISSRGSAFVSAVHDAQDGAAFIACLERAVTRMRAEGVA